MDYSQIAFTVTGGFIAAITAQIVSHFYSRRREDEKYNKEAHQKLMPIILDLMVYFEATTAIRNEIVVMPSVDQDKLKQQIVEKIGENVKFSNGDVITFYYNSIRKDYFTHDKEKYKRNKTEINLFICLLDYIIKLNKRTKLLNKSLLEAVVGFRVRYLVLLMLIGLGMKEEAIGWFITHMFNGGADKIKNSLYFRLVRDNMKVAKKLGYRSLNSRTSRFFSKFFGLKRNYGKDEAIAELKLSLINVARFTSENPNVCENILRDEQRFEVL